MKGVAALGGLALAAAALFLAAPGLDLWASGLFWRPGDGFFLAGSGPVRLLYAAVPFLTEGVLILAVAAVVSLLWRGRPLAGLDRKAIAFLVASLALGPGLAANTLLKDHWGRARPSQVEEFGGTRHFTPALLPAAECARNCSFVAGHAAMGFYLVSFALLVRERRRRAVAVAGAVAAGAAIGIARIAQGGHFLSDVVFAGLLVCAIAWALHVWIVERDGVARLWRLMGSFLPIPRTSPPPPAGEGRGGGSALQASGYPGAFRASSPSRPSPAGGGGEDGRSRDVDWRRFLAFSIAALAATAAAILWADKPVALWFKAHEAVFLPVFRIVTQLGVSTGFLAGTALLFVALRLAPRLRRFAGRAEAFRARSWVPAFVFVAIAASGLTVNLLKAVFGRPRPKLLFAQSDYYFGWFGFRADYWSFPSGHAATIVALAAALSLLWPRWVFLYAVVAAVVAFSRVVVAAHYLSDVIAASWIAIVVTWYVARVFERSGIRLDDALAGRATSPPRLTWPERLGFRRFVSSP